MEGVVTIGTVGTILYEMESRGRHLINVQWDNGVISLVSPREIEVIEGDIIWQ